MPELSKILLEVKMAESIIQNLFQAHHPRFINLFVEATKTVSGYDARTDVYEAPTFAMNIATSLKQCCDTAITLALTNQTQISSLTAADVEANLKTMIHLFE